MKNRSKNASWHRFLMDFGGFLEASWEGKWSQDRSKKASKKRWKNGRRQDGHKMRIRRSNASRNQSSRALGRYPSKSGANPPLPWRKNSAPPLCLPKSCLVLSLSLSCLVLSCLALSCPVLAQIPCQLASKNPPKSIKNRCQDAFPS